MVLGAHANSLLQSSEDQGGETAHAFPAPGSTGTALARDGQREQLQRTPSNHKQPLCAS